MTPREPGSVLSGPSRWEGRIVRTVVSDDGVGVRAEFFNGERWVPGGGAEDAVLGRQLLPEEVADLERSSTSDGTS